MGESITITHGQGNLLLNSAQTYKFPKEVGGRAFNDMAQGKINEKFRLLFKALKKVSTKRDGKYMFGDFKTWKAIELKSSTMNTGGPISLEMAEVQKITEYQLIDQDAEFTVNDITGAIKSGLYWLCYLWTHPASPNCLNPGHQDDYVWPIVEKIGKVADLRKDIGLVGEGDDEYFGDAPAEKKPEAAPAA